MNAKSIQRVAILGLGLDQARTVNNDVEAIHARARSTFATR